jgi:zinc protease
MTSRQSRVVLAFLAALVGPAATAAAQTPSVTRHVLPNGMTVIVRENPAAPVVTVSLQVQAGARIETPETAGITNFLVRTMIRGTARRSGTALAESAEDLGGSLDASGEVESAEIRGEALARYWADLLGLIAEVALEPSLVDEEIERERRLILSQIKTRAETPFALSLDTLLQALYGSHPYAWQRLGLKSAVERLGRGELTAHYRRVFRAARTVLAVSGQVSHERVVRTAERLFAKLPRSGGREVDAAAPAAPSGGRRVLERPAQQAQVLVGYVGPGLNDPAYPAVRVLGAVLGGGMASRLFAELREKRGLAYSLGVLTPFRTGPAFFVAHLGTAPENAAAAEAALLAELEKVRQAPADDHELARAKAYLVGTFAMDRRTNARQAWHLAFFEVIGAGWEFGDRYAQALEAVTAADVETAAQRYLVRPTIVVLQPPSR